MNFKIASKIFMFGILMSVAARAEETVSQRLYQWKSTPTIANCYGKNLDISFITNAVNYWESKGEEIGGIVNNPPKAFCQAGYVDGYIILKGTSNGQLNEKTLAIAHRNVFKDQILSTVIYFKPSTFVLSWVMEHEIGHALGYEHVEQENHVMHPEQELMGPDF